MKPRLAMGTLAVLSMLVVPGLPAAEAEIDRHGRPLWDTAGRIHYAWNAEQGQWYARHADGRVEAAPGPAPEEDGGLGPRNHSGYTLQAYRLEGHPGGWPEAVAIGDLTGDGRADVVLTTTTGEPENEYRVHLFPQLPDGTLGAWTSYSYLERASRNGIVLADMNEDGLLDVVVGHGAGITILPADGSGGLGPARVVVDDDADTLAATDVGLDGHLDVVSLGWSRGATLFHGDGTGQIERQEPLATNAAGYNDHEIEDLNGDCRPDLAVMSGQLFAVPNLTVHTHDGIDAYLPDPDEYFVGVNELTRGVGLGDVTADGRHDVVLSRGRNRPTHLWIYDQDASGALTGPRTIETYDIAEPVVVRDLDGDGTEDVLTAHGGWERVGVYLQDAGTLEPEALYQIPYASHYAPQGLAAGDFTGDGCPDVAIADYNNGLVVLHGDGCVALQQDADGDTVPDVRDVCPETPDPQQTDADCDGVGDRCAAPCADADGDLVCDDRDNCPGTPNPDQDDLDQDGAGDACDPDIDGDGLDNGEDCDPLDADLWRTGGEVGGLRVVRPPNGAIVVSWVDQRDVTGPGARYDLAHGILGHLGEDDGFDRAGCLPDPGGPSADLAEPGSRWILAAVRSTCGSGGWGTSFGIGDRRAFLDDPATDPCR